MTRFRLAVVGAGRAGMVHATNAAHWLGDAELVCLVESDDARAAEVGKALDVPVHPSIDDAIAHELFDGVVITTPTFTHRDIAVRAAAAGKHIFCEKPLALTLDDCDEMIACAEDACVVLQVGFVRRFQTEFVEAKRRIDEGAIGTPMLVKSLTRGPGLPPAWAHDLHASNGMLAEVNSHDFDSVRWLVGSEIERVYAEVANFKGRERGVTAEGFYDNAVVTLRFESGAIGTIDGTCPLDVGYDARVEIIGTEGLLVIGRHQATSLLEVRARGVGHVPTFASWPQRFESGYREELRAFVEAARTGGEPLVTGADGRAAVAGVLAANRAWLEGRPVELRRGVLA